jgi:hypothetical protein
VSVVVLDDHLLRDLLIGHVGPRLARQLSGRQPVTTNLYLVRLCRSLVAARGGRLTGTLPPELRRGLARSVAGLADDVEIVPMRTLALRMADLADRDRLSTLGSEAVAAAEHLGAPLCVWSGDDGPRVRASSIRVGVRYEAIDR